MQWLEGSVIRTARKEWRCMGDGAAPATRRYACTFAAGGRATIQKGEQYLEYLGEARAYEHGTSHCMACARAFYRAGGGETLRCAAHGTDILIAPCGLCDLDGVPLADFHEEWARHEHPANTGPASELDARQRIRIG